MDTTLSAVAVISACAALLGVVLGPSIQLYIAKRQIRASLVSANRQAWINALRNELVDYQAATAKVGNLLLQHPEAANDPLASPSFMEKMYESARVKVRITLLMNPDEYEHRMLLQRIEDMKIDHTNPDATRNYNAAEARFLEQAQKVLKLEWERVKRGE